MKILRTILSLASRISDFGFQISNPRAQAAKRGFQISNLKFQISNPSSRLLALVCLMSGVLVASAQNSTINVGSQGRLIIATPDGRQLVITGQTVVRFRNGQPVIENGQGVIDPQLAAAMQYADGQSVAQAEFDPPVVSLGEPVTYRIVITAMPESAALPEHLPSLPGLTFTPGGHTFNFVPSEGRMQPRTTYNFRVTTATNGAFFMPSFQASANGKPVPVTETHLAVLPRGVPPPEQAARLVIEPPSGEFYVGQSVPVRVVMLDSGDHSLEAMSQAQVSGEALVADGGAMAYRNEQRIVQGRPVSAMVSDLCVTPVREGRLSMVAQAVGHFNRPSRPSGITLPGHQPLLDSVEAFITVKHVPKEGELPGFSGAIGQFQLEPPRPSSTLIRAGDPMTLTVMVRGRGNFSRITAPKLARAEGWQLFTPSVGGFQPDLPNQPGFVTFNFSLIPLGSGVKATPRIPFCYFDPVKRAYVDLSIPPVPVTVKGDDTNAMAALQAGPASTVSTSPDPVMAGLARVPGPVAGSRVPVQQRPWFLALQLLPLGTLAGLWIWSSRRRYLAAHPGVVRRIQARRGMRVQLRLARKAVTKRDAAGFVRASVNALRQAASVRAAAHPEALVCADVLAVLPSTGIDGRADTLVRRLFQADDERQFIDRAPESGAMLSMQADVMELLEKWRQSL
jgi:hypothetical protein